MGSEMCIRDRLYLEAALIYWLFCLVLSSGQGMIEKRLDRYVAH